MDVVDGDVDVLQDDAVFNNLIRGEHTGDSDVDDGKPDIPEFGQPCADQDKLLDHSPTGLQGPSKFTKKERGNNV